MLILEYAPMILLSSQSCVSSNSGLNRPMVRTGLTAIRGFSLDNDSRIGPEDQRGDVSQLTASGAGNANSPLSAHAVLQMAAPADDLPDRVCT
jgi:hypothetical protein